MGCLRAPLALLCSLLGVASSLLSAPPIIGRKRSPPRRSAVPGEDDGFSSAGGASNRRRRRPSRRNPSPPRSQRRRPPRTAEPGLGNLCPPLEGPVGAPPLPALATEDPRVIERWLEEHAGVGSPDGRAVLGFDSESIAKPPWMPDRASLPDGPATVQLSTPASCIVVQLARCGDGSALHAPDVLRDVINDPRIVKVGVGIDDDALELYRWSKESAADESQLWKMTSRFDIGRILPDSNPSRRSGLRELGRRVLGVEVLKSKRLAMSNWGAPLNMKQIAYAARDAWVSAAIVERLREGNGEAFRAEALLEMEFLKNQRSMEVVDERARARKAAKMELKELKERQDNEGAPDGDVDEERMQALNDLLDLHRPDQPPRFDDDAFTLPLY